MTGSEDTPATGEPPRGPSAAKLATMASLERDRQTAEVYGWLRDAGVTAILLKGPAVSSWLWPDGPREYVDADLLVSPAQFEHAERLLRSRGYERTIFPEEIGMAVEYAAPGPAQMSVDLHRTFRHVGVEPQRCWDLLSARTRSLSLPGGEVLVPTPIALGVIVALHSIWHEGTNERALEDVRRAVHSLDLADWRQAAGLAGDLAALEAFTAGLSTIGPGRELVSELGLPSVTSAEFRLRLSDPPPVSLGWLALLRARRSPFQHLSWLVRELFPPANQMRRRYAFAKNSRAGLLASYAIRLGWLVAHTPRGIRSAWRALDEERRRR